MTPCPLTPSQLRLVQAAAQGGTFRDVAARLGRRHEGVKSDWAAARRRAGARNRAHLVAIALGNGWIE